MIKIIAKQQYRIKRRKIVTAIFLGLTPKSKFPSRKSLPPQSDIKQQSGETIYSEKLSSKFKYSMILTTGIPPEGIFCRKGITPTLVS